MAAVSWGMIVVANKALLRCLNPLPTNLLLRLVAVPILLVTLGSLALLHISDFAFAITWQAAALIAVAAGIVWLWSFTTYSYALRSGRVSVVSPITGLESVFTALFAPLILGTRLSPLTLAGLAVAVAGAILLGLWTSPETQTGRRATLDGDACDPAPRSRSRYSPWKVVLLSMATAIGWGLAPVIIELAQDLNGGVSGAMIIEAEALSIPMIAALVRISRSPFLVVPLGFGDRRKVIRLLLGAGSLQALYSILMFLVIDHAGAVLFMIVVASSPAWAMIGGVLFLRERVPLRVAFAGSLAVAGALLAIIARA